MRIKIIFSLSNPKLPIIYRHRFVAFIKDCLQKTDSNYKNTIYPSENSEKTKIPKPFSFAVQLPTIKETKKEKIIIDSNFEVEDMVFYFPENKNVSLLISSCDYEFIVNLYNGILQNQTFQLTNDVKIFFKKSFVLKEKKIQDNEVVFKTLSSISIETKEGKSILPFSDIDAFNREFNIIHDKILKDIRGYGLKSPLYFENIKLKEQIVKHTFKKFREKTSKPYMYLNCFMGLFKLKGDPEDLQILYQKGIGLRTGQGFGMVEVV